MDKKKSISVLIAAKDEEQSIAHVIESHISLLKNTNIPIEWEVGILDDGSTDQTLEIAQSLQVRYPELKIWHNDTPSGIANAFRQLAENAQHEWIYITSGDGQFPAEALDLMIQAWIVNPITTLGVRGSRFASYGTWRSFISFVFQTSTRVVLRINLRDPGSVKIIMREISLIDTKSKSTMRDAELLATAHHLYSGLQFVEIPFLPRNTGSSSGTKPRNLIMNVWDLLVLALLFTRQRNMRKPNTAAF